MRLRPRQLRRMLATKRSPFHPRNRHAGSYDLPALALAHPPLGSLIIPNSRTGQPTVDFSDPKAVRALNAAILAKDYQIESWDLPAEALVPPIPSRADYIHLMADRLHADAGTIPLGPGVRCLDVGTGASAIYPLLGHSEYGVQPLATGWSFVGTDISKQSLASAQRVVSANRLEHAIQLVQSQQRPGEAQHQILSGSPISQAQSSFALTFCNPPFHSTRKKAEAAAARRTRNLQSLDQRSVGKAQRSVGKAPDQLNFGGLPRELWCRGGEMAFVSDMIAQSSPLQNRCVWFSSLVSQASHAQRLAVLAQQQVESTGGCVELMQLQTSLKSATVVSWTYLPLHERRTMIDQMMQQSEMGIRP